VEDRRRMRQLDPAAALGIPDELSMTGSPSPGSAITGFDPLGPLAGERDTFES